MPRVHRLVLGLVCGWILARLRLVPGDAWLAGPACEASGALVVRGAAVAFVGLALGSIGRDVGWAFLVGLAAAVAGHGLLLGWPLGLPALDVLVAGAVLGIVVWTVRRDEARRADSGPVPARIGERIGLFVAGGGAALVLEVVARHLRLLGGGLAQDDAAFGATFAVLVALGSVCFGWITSLRKLERWVFPWLVAATAAAGYWSLRTVEGLGQILEFGRFLSRYGLDASWHSTLAADALIAGAVLVLPAFLLGLALRGARGAGSLSSLLVGAGVGLAILPRILQRDPAAGTNVTEIFSAQLLPFGVLATLLGASLAIFSVPGSGARQRWIGFALALPLGLPVLLVESKPLFLLSPWERRPTLPFLAFETPEGLATVEPGDGGLKVATLERRRLSPGLDGVRADSQAIQTSFLALPRAVREARATRVLLVGQLTQVRAAEFARMGAARIDRTGAWHATMPRLEGELLKDFVALPGDVIEPREAAARLADGRYDLCVALATEGDPPHWRAIAETPGNTVVVRWSRIEEPLVAQLPGSRFAGAGAREPLYALAGGGLDQLMLGVLDGAERPAAGEGGEIELVRLDGSPPRTLPVTRLAERKRWRAASATARVAAVLVQEDDRLLLRGVDAFARLQVPSSPFETDSQQVELDDATLSTLRDAALAGPPSAFTRDVWNWLARVLAGKRDVAAIETHVAPLAARWAPWPELEVALARADLEALDPEAAARRLAPLAAAADPSFDVLAVLGEAREQAGDATGALEAWKRALLLRPADRLVGRRLAIARPANRAARTRSGACSRRNPRTRNCDRSWARAPGPPSSAGRRRKRDPTRFRPGYACSILWARRKPAPRRLKRVFLSTFRSRTSGTSAGSAPSQPNGARIHGRGGLAGPTAPNPACTVCDLSQKERSSMIQKTLSALVLGGIALAGAAVLGTAQIERLDLNQMVQRADDAVIGTVTARNVIRIDHPVDGPELYYTSLTIEGRSLSTNEPRTVDVWFGGGFIDATNGAFNSEAPSMDDQKVGNKVVAFYKFEENMGGDLSGNALMTWHGGLYRTFESRRTTFVQGRGNGYAIPTNVRLDELDAQVKSLAQAKRK